MRVIVARCHAVLFALFAVLVISGPGVSAQENKPDSTKISQKEANLAKKLQEGTDVAAKLKLGEKLVKEFPESPIRNQVAGYLGAQIGSVADLGQQSALIDSYLKIFTKPGESDAIAPTRIEFLNKSNRNDEAFKLGGEYLSRKPGDILVALHLATTGVTLARNNRKGFAAPGRDFAQKAIDVIEGGKKPADMSDGDWTQAQGPWYAQLYQSMGFLYSAEGYNFEALASFDKATKLDPKDVNSWVMMGFIVNQNYQSLAKKYQGAVGNEQAELRKQAEAELDRVIEMFARVVALTDGVAAQSELNGQVRNDLEMYYKFRNGGKTDGMQALIDRFKTSK